MQTLQPHSHGLKAALWIAIPLALLLIARVWCMAALPIWNPSESRYATLSANMAETNDYIRPIFYHHDQQQVFAGKPPLAFQMGGIACEILGRNAFAVRLPSFLCAIGILFLLQWASGRWRASLLCLTTLGFAAFAGLCMTDMPLAFCVCGMLTVFWKYHATPRLDLALLLGAFAAGGFMVKGPVALALGGLPMLVWCLLNGFPKGLRLSHILFAAALFLALTAPWFVVMERLEPGSLRYFFLNENLGRFLTQSYGDRYGSGHYFFFGVSVPWFLLLSLPWGLLLFRKRAWHRLRFNFPAIAALTMIGFWALTPRVPLAYLLPAVPMAAWWSAKRAVRFRRAWCIAALTCALLFAVAPILLPQLKPNKFPLALYNALPPRATLSFVGHAPYSAEFYLGPRVNRDGSGDYIAQRQGRKWTLLPNATFRASNQPPQSFHAQPDHAQPKADLAENLLPIALQAP